MNERKVIHMPIYEYRLYTSNYDEYFFGIHISTLVVGYWGEKNYSKRNEELIKKEIIKNLERNAGKVLLYHLDRFGKENFIIDKINQLYNNQDIDTVRKEFIDGTYKIDRNRKAHFVECNNYGYLYKITVIKPDDKYFGSVYIGQKVVCDDNFDINYYGSSKHLLLGYRVNHNNEHRHIESIVQKWINELRNTGYNKSQAKSKVLKEYLKVELLLLRTNKEITSLDDLHFFDRTEIICNSTNLNTIMRNFNLCSPIICYEDINKLERKVIKVARESGLNVLNGNYITIENGKEVLHTVGEVPWLNIPAFDKHINHILSGLEPQSILANELGVSETTINKWVKQFKETNNITSPIPQYEPWELCDEFLGAIDKYLNNEISLLKLSKICKKPRGTIDRWIKSYCKTTNKGKIHVNPWDNLDNFIEGAERVIKGEITCADLARLCCKHNQVTIDWFRLYCIDIGIDPEQYITKPPSWKDSTTFLENINDYNEGKINKTDLARKCDIPFSTMSIMLKNYYLDTGNIHKKLNAWENNSLFLENIERYIYGEITRDEMADICHIAKSTVSRWSVDYQNKHNIIVRPWEKNKIFLNNVLRCLSGYITQCELAKLCNIGTDTLKNYIDDYTQKHNIDKSTVYLRSWQRNEGFMNNIELYMNGEIQLKTLANQCNRDHACVKGWVNQYCKYHKRAHVKYKGKLHTGPQKQDWHKNKSFILNVPLIFEGTLLIRDLATICNVKKCTISKWVKEFSEENGRPTKKRSWERSLPFMDNIKKHLGGKYTRKEFAAICGITTKLLSSWIIKYKKNNDLLSE